MLDAKAIGKRLTLIRENLHGIKTQKRFADLLGVEANRYNNWESGIGRIPTDQAIKVKAITPGIDLDYIFEGKLNGLTVQVCLKLYPAPKDKEAD